MNGRARYAAWVIGLMLTLGCSTLLSAGFGSAKVPIATVVHILLDGPGSQGGSVWSAAQVSIIWQIRLPRILLGMIVGAALTLVGCTLQAVTRNPLADPHLLGTTSGAALGAVIALLFLGEMLGPLTLPVAAFLGALGSLLLVLIIARQRGRLEASRLLLAGVAVGFVLMALANLLLFIGDHRAASSVLFWLLGGLGLARWDLLPIPALTLVATFIVLFAQGRTLNALMAGEQTAVTLGCNVNQARLVAFICASLLTGVMVAVSGAIGFVGLMLPHLARRFIGAEHRQLLPVAALLGALFLLWVDVAARTLFAPEDLPIGIATAILGGGFFLLLMHKR